VDPRSGNRWLMAVRPYSEAARPYGISVQPVAIATLADVEQAFKALGDPVTCAAMQGIQTAVEPPAMAALAIRYRIALMGSVHDGALMLHTLTFAEPDRRIAAIIDKILRGTKPANIPFETPEHTNFGLNRATAKAIGVELPQDLLIRATEVIG
jgi:putative ABC transport system substrate-binding protein